MSEKLYAINKSHGNLTLKAGYLQIKIGGYATIFESDKSHPDFQDAVSKNWLEYSDTEPTTSSVPAVKAIEFVEPVQGMTAEELKAELAKGKEEKPIATTEALGRSETVVAEPTVTKLGGDQEATEPEVEAETKKGRGKKAAE